MKVRLVALLFLLSTLTFAQPYLVSVTPLDTTSQIFINFFANGRAKYDVANYKLVYNTSDVDGSPTTASGLVSIPLKNCDSLALISYAHGTVLRRNDVPSRNNFESTIGKVFASTGYVCTMPDYLGLGDNPGIHPYLHAESQATATVDLMRAAREFLQDSLTGINLNGEVLLTGYSQGGHAAMAVAKYIQDQNLFNEFNVIGAAPASGPYNLAGSQSEVFLYDQPYSNPGYVVYLIMGLNRAYGNLFTNPSDFLKAPYDTLIPPFFNGSFAMDTVNQLLPSRVSMYIEDSILRAFVADSVAQQHPLWQALNLNTNYNWAPQMPMRMYYCTNDEQVDFQNSLDALQAMTAAGATQVQAISNGPLNHGGCVVPSISAAGFFFDSVSTSCEAFVSLPESEAITSLDFYPNPVEQFLHFKGEENGGPFQFMLFAQNGQLLIERTFEHAGQIDLSALSSGVYYMHLQQGEGILRERIIKR